MRFLSWMSCLLLFSSSIVFANFNDVSSQENTSPLQVTERVTTSNGFQVNLSIREPEWVTVSLTDDGDPLQMLEFGNGGAMVEEGRPQIPVAGQMFRLPPTGGARVEILSYDYETISDIDYATMIGSEELDGYAETYHPVDEWYPEVIAQVGEPALFHDFRVTNLITFPVQVNTARREVRIYHNLEIEIHYDVEDNTNSLPHQPLRISESFLPWYRIMLDWDESELDEFETYHGNMIVVMQNNATLISLMEPWFEWKRQKGWTIDTITSSDCSWTNTAIRQELIERYENAETPFDYVVVIGDAQGTFSVPPGQTYGDHYYATLVGTDQLVDVGIGRISVENTTHVLTYVNKVFTYERDVNTNNMGWYTEGHCAVASDHSGIGTVYTGMYAKEAMLAIGYDNVTEAYISPWGAYPTGSQVNSYSASRFNAGISYYTCRGYGGAGLSTSAIGNLTNTDMTPVCVDLTCMTGDWAYGYGINEAYMRVGTATQARGGIGAMGNATGGTNPRFNNSLSAGSAYSMLVLRNPYLGDVHMGGKLNIWNNFQGLDGGINSFNEWFNLMGDPTVMVWTAAPLPLTVEAEDEVELGDNSYTVTVLQDETPVEGAWVTFYKVDDDEEVIAHAVTNADGEVILDTPVRFAGEAMLTVTRQNHIPYRLEVDIVNPDERIGYVDITIQDNGSGGTQGNANGIAEAGETVGLIISAKNFGTSSQSNVTVTATCPDTLAMNVSGTVTFGTIAAGATTEGNGLILVEIDGDTQNDWILHLNMNIDGSLGEYADDYQLNIAAIQFAFVDDDYPDGRIDPGETGTITFEVMNIGGSNASSPVGYLYSLDPYLGIAVNEADFSDIMIGQSATSAEFTISSHPETFPGHQASAFLVISADNDQCDTVHVSIALGSASSDDPSGPDSYGYFAFDNTDDDYEMAPEYDWIEINPSAPNNDFDGTLLNIHDSGNDQDDALAIDLPFAVQYYGEEFDEMTVCSNGWIAMGDQHEMANSRNWVIPAPLGPNYMIAPYWDERFVPGNSTSGVYSYYDEPNGQFIVEWYAAKDYQNSNPCTFQVVFYSQTIRPTFSGDTDILFQYNNMSHTMGSTWDTSADTYWWTTGIENGDQTDGVLLWYWNIGRSGAAQISNGRAILFTTNIAMITGSIEGTVIDLETNEPIENASVRTDNWVYQTTTNADGEYLLEDIIVGVHNIVATSRGYNLTTETDVTVEENQTATVNFALSHPEFSIEPDSIYQLLRPDSSTTVSLELTNNGNGPLSYFVEMDFFGPDQTTDRNPGDRGPIREIDDLDEPWEWIYSFDLTNAESRNRGIAFDGTYFWVSGSNGYDSEGYNKLYKYDSEGLLLDVYDQPVENHSAAGFYGLAWDGQYLYGVDERYLFKMEPLEDGIDLIDSMQVPIPTARYLTYDPEHDLFWLGDITTNIRGIDRSGEIVYSHTQSFYPRGASWFGSDEDGYNLYFVARQSSEEPVLIIKMDAETGSSQQVYSFEYDTTPSGAFATNEWNPLIYSLVSIMDGGSQDMVQMWEIDRNRDWIAIDPTEGVVEPNGQATIQVDLASGILPEGVYSVWLRFDHNAYDLQTYIPLVMEVSEVGIHSDNRDEIPLDWSFDGAYPNPFNPSASISFTLKEHANVNARIFNVLGREIAVLANRPMTAGQQTLTFDGSRLASGVYFLRLEAGELQHTQKLLLLK